MLQYPQILFFRFNLFQCMFIFLILLPTQAVLPQSIKVKEKTKEGIKYFDTSQNIRIKDRKIMRNNVNLIKLDCGNICNTSYASEHILHKGRIKF